MNKPKKLPAHEIRIGLIRATIWEQNHQENSWHNVTFSRMYKDGTEWKYSESFHRDDLLVLGKVADQAHSWIIEQRTAKENSSRRETAVPPR